MRVHSGDDARIIHVALGDTLAPLGKRSIVLLGYFSIPTFCSYHGQTPSCATRWKDKPSVPMPTWTRPKYLPHHYSILQCPQFPPLYGNPAPETREDSVHSA